jgi:ribA/ribD-fused uncharacterized protein
MTIYFYSTRGEYGAFTNFARHGFELDGKYWPTSEHYFQAQKFAGTDYAEQIRTAKTPKQAATLGRSRTQPLRPDWEQVKEEVMRHALLAKFQSTDALRDLLMSTGDQEIIEDSPTDYYWGCGKTRTGKNRLGVILMEVRATLREKAEKVAHA